MDILRSIWPPVLAPVYFLICIVQMSWAIFDDGNSIFDKQNTISVFRLLLDWRKVETSRMEVTDRRVNMEIIKLHSTVEFLQGVH